jgi:hypothetical protein
LSKRGLNVRSVSSFPEPGNPLQSIVFCQAAPPDISKNPGFGPLLKLAMDHGRPDTLKFFTRQRIPDNSCPKYIHDGGKIQAVRVFSLSAATWFAQVRFFLFSSRVHRDQWFHQVPKRIGNFPSLGTRHILASFSLFLKDYQGLITKLQDIYL